MQRFKVWQVGWEHEGKEIEVDEGECAACKVVHHLPAGTNVVMGMQLDDESPREEVDFRIIDSGFLGLGLFCREATAEEVSAAREFARDVAEGKASPHAETEEETRAFARLVGLVRESPDFFVGALLGTSRSRLAQHVGNGLLSSWAGRQAAELGKRATEKKASEKK